MKQKISKSYALILGITLFSMFFGSGNLIFPPFMGFQAGTRTGISLLGFSLTAIVFPVLAVIVISKTQDLMHLSERVGKKFALIFTILVFLSLGPGLAIPRNAAVSFEMAVVPFAGEVSAGIRLLYSIVFFTAAYFLSVYPEKLSDWLGKILGPILLVMMLAVVAGCFIKAPGSFSAPSGDYADHQFVKGFMDGYNTMDTLAALNFGNVIALNIMSRGIRDQKTIVRYTMHAGWIAGLLLLVVYAALAYAGALSSGMFTAASNGANVLTSLVYELYGNAGVVILGVIFVLSCLTTCVGLLCSCAEYFASISKLSYKTWVTIFTIAGCAFSVVGLNQLLKISVPFLTAVYPIAMVLVILGLFDEKISRFPKIYPCAILLTGIASVIYAMNSAGIVIPGITSFIINLAPNTDLCWLIPSLVGIAVGVILSMHADKSTAAETKRQL